MVQESIPRPSPELTKDGRRIVYPIWRDDMAEAIIELVKKKPSGNSV